MIDLILFARYSSLAVDNFNRKEAVRYECIYIYMFLLFPLSFLSVNVKFAWRIFRESRYIFFLASLFSCWEFLFLYELEKIGIIINIGRM